MKKQLTNILLQKAMFLHVAFLAAFTSNAKKAYGYTDGDWILRAGAVTGYYGIFVRVLDVSGTNKVYAFLAGSINNELWFIPASKLRGALSGTDFRSINWGIPESFITGKFEEAAPTGYSIDANDYNKVKTIDSVAVTSNDIPATSFRDAALPNEDMWRFPTTSGWFRFIGSSSDGRSNLQQKTPVAYADSTPSTIITSSNSQNDTTAASQNWWQKLPAYLRTTIIVSLIVIVLIILSKLIKVRR